MNAPFPRTVLSLLLIVANLLVLEPRKAQAASCSAADKKYFVTYMNAFSDAAGIDGTQDPSKMFNIATAASKKSKSKKLQAEWKKLIKAMDSEISGFPYDWIYDSSKVGQSIERLNGLIEYKRC